MKKKTEELTRTLRQTTPAQLDGYLAANGAELLPEDCTFPAYMRAAIRRHGVLQQTVFLRADVAESYGYKLISGEKRTRKRDVIYRLCLAAEFTAEETDRALRLYGLPPLYARDPRDAILTVALNGGFREAERVNELLRRYGLPPLEGVRDSWSD